MDRVALYKEKINKRAAFRLRSKTYSSNPLGMLKLKAESERKGNLELKKLFSKLNVNMRETEKRLANAGHFKSVNDLNKLKTYKDLHSKFKGHIESAKDKGKSLTNISKHKSLSKKASYEEIRQKGKKIGGINLDKVAFYKEEIMKIAEEKRRDLEANVGRGAIMGNSIGLPVGLIGGTALNVVKSPQIKELLNAAKAKGARGTSARAALLGILGRGAISGGKGAAYGTLAGSLGGAIKGRIEERKK